MVNVMGADVLATQGAKAPATMASPMLNQNSLVPASQELKATDNHLPNVYRWGMCTETLK